MASTTCKASLASAALMCCGSTNCAGSSFAEAVKSNKSAVAVVVRGDWARLRTAAAFWWWKTAGAAAVACPAPGDAFTGAAALASARAASRAPRRCSAAVLASAPLASTARKSLGAGLASAALPPSDNKHLYGSSTSFDSSKPCGRPLASG